MCILRLICTSTVEENILRKANQKRMLGDIAIEGGAFTTDFFKQVITLALAHGTSTQCIPASVGFLERAVWWL